MSPRGYYSDEDDVDIHVRHRERSPGPVRYVQSPPQPRSYYGAPMTAPGFLGPEQHTTLIARSRSRDRSRERRHESPPQPPAPANPVIIHNRVYYDHSSDDDEESDYSDHHKRRRSSARSRRRSRSRSHSRPDYMTREDWEAENARRELERMRIARDRDVDERRIEKDYRKESELQRAKRELDEIKRRESRAEEEQRIKADLEFEQLRQKQKETEDKKRREKAEKEAIERYKQAEHERKVKEDQEKEEEEREYKRRLQEDLLKSGLDEKAIAAIMKNEKVGEGKELVPTGDRPTYTRMSRRHLSIETLRTFRIDYDFDTNPEFILIKRWVPEWEQDRFWTHTKYIREKRDKHLVVEERRHPRHEPEFEWVRKKHDRKRSKSPGLLTYLAGGRPH